MELLCNLSRFAGLHPWIWCHFCHVSSINAPTNPINLSPTRPGCLPFALYSEFVIGLAFPTVLDVLLLALTVTRTYQNARLLEGEFGSPIVRWRATDIWIQFDVFGEVVYIAPGRDPVSLCSDCSALPLRLFPQTLCRHCMPLLHLRSLDLRPPFR